MDYSNRAGLRLLAAVRRFSDPVAWTEFERLLGLDASAKERARCNASDWVRHDFQVTLKLDAARQRLAEGLPALHRWAQLKTVFQARLQSGELVATGYVKPARIEDGPIAIPADKWRFLQPDFRNSTAAGGGLEIVSVLVYRAESQVASRGRKTDVESQRLAVLSAFDEMANAGEVSYEHGGLQRAAEALNHKFPTYKTDSIRKIIQDDYKQLRKSKK